MYLNIEIFYYIESSKMTCYDHHSVIKKNIAAKLTLTLTLKFRTKFFIASYSSHDEDKKSEKNHGMQLNRSLGREC